jgi:hypothetical protein
MLKLVLPLIDGPRRGDPTAVAVRFIPATPPNL